MVKVTTLSPASHSSLLLAFINKTTSKKIKAIVTTENPLNNTEVSATFSKSAHALSVQDRTCHTDMVLMEKSAIPTRNTKIIHTKKEFTQ